MSGKISKVTRQPSLQPVSRVMRVCDLRSKMINQSNPNTDLQMPMPPGQREGFQVSEKIILYFIKSKNM